MIVLGFRSQQFLDESDPYRNRLLDVKESVLSSAVLRWCSRFVFLGSGQGRVYAEAGSVGNLSRQRGFCVCDRDDDSTDLARWRAAASRARPIYNGHLLRPVRHGQLHVHDVVHPVSREDRLGRCGDIPERFTLHFTLHGALPC